MLNYILKRLLFGIAVIVISLIIIFISIRIIPGSPIGKLVGYENYSQEMAELLTHKYGLDKPLFSQFIIYLKNLFQGDFGYSYVNNSPVTEIILNKVAGTLILIIPATLISFFLGIWLAFFVHKKKGAIEKSFDFLGAVLGSIPGFILSLMLIYGFSYKLNLLPTTGMYSLREEYFGIEKFLDLLKHLILPVITLVLVDSAFFYRVSKDIIKTEFSKDYYTYLKAYKVKSNVLLNKYLLKNSMPTLLNTLSFAMTRIVSGALFIEIFFSWPGMGRLISEAISNRDYLVVSGTFLFLVVFIVIFMLMIDLLIIAISPKKGGNFYEN